MSIRRNWAFGALILTLSAVALTVGCSRTLGPVAPPPVAKATPTSVGTATFTLSPTGTRTNTPTYTPTFTYTGTSTYSHTFTHSPTHTLSPTNTWTSQFTNTFTIIPTDTPTFTYTLSHTPTTPGAPTDTFTYTATDSPTPTHTPTITPTESFTSTHTLTPTPTATLDPSMIDDCEDGDGQVLPNGGRAGYWYTYGDGTGTIVPDPAGSFTMVLGGNPGNMAQITGNGFTNWGAGMGLNFLEEISPGVKASYDASAYTGVIFDIRVGSGSTTSVRFEVPASATNADTGHFGVDLTASTAWQSVTVFFNLMTQPNWATPASFTASDVYGLQWKVGTGVTFDVQVDNIRFTTIVGPTPTPSPTNDPLLFDNMADNDGQVSPNGGRTGYWYTMTDLNAGGNSTVWPPEGVDFIMSSPSGQTDGYAARITGTLGADYQYRFIGLGANMLDPKAVYDATTYYGFTFYARLGNTASATIVRVSVPNQDTALEGGVCSPAADCDNNYGYDLALTTTWQAVTVYFNLMTQESGWGYTPPSGFTASNIYSFQWQVKGATGATVDFWVDDIRLIDIPGPTPTPTQPPDPLLIDNMDDNDSQINVISGRDGYWYSFSDVSEASWPVTEAHSTVWPPADPFVMSAPGYSSSYALRTTGTIRASCAPAYLYCGYAAIAFDFVNKPTTVTQKVIYDLSAFTGVQFYAKNNAAGLATRWRLNVPDYFTSPVAEGGDCPSACSNNFGWELGSPYFGPTPMINPGLNTTWQQYQIPFWVMCQEQYWGHNVTSADVATCNDAPTTPNSGCLDLTKVFGMQFKLNNDSFGMNFDFWVDDMRLYP